MQDEKPREDGVIAGNAAQFYFNLNDLEL